MMPAEVVGVPNLAVTPAALRATPSTVMVTVAVDVTAKPESKRPLSASSTRERETTGAVVSIVMTTALEAELTLPAASRWVAVMLCAVSLVSETVAAHAPVSLAVVVPTTVVPSRTVMVEPASAVPEMVWVVLLVVIAEV